MEKIGSIPGSAEFDSEVRALIRRTVKAHMRIIFNGNGYSKEWFEEAANRKLPNVSSMVEAIPYLTKEESVAVFERHRVLSRTELLARAEIHYETYSKAINIEAKTMVEMASKLYIPAVISYVERIAASLGAVKSALPPLIQVCRKTFLLKLPPSFQRRRGHLNF